jgi:hypothetical protein
MISLSILLVTRLLFVILFHRCGLGMNYYVLLNRCGLGGWITIFYVTGVDWGMNYLRYKSWKPECVLGFNMGWRIFTIPGKCEWNWFVSVKWGGNINWISYPLIYPTYTTHWHTQPILSIDIPNLAYPLTYPTYPTHWHTQPILPIDIPNLSYPLTYSTFPTHWHTQPILPIDIPNLSYPLTYPSYMLSMSIDRIDWVCQWVV